MEEVMVELAKCQTAKQSATMAKNAPQLVVDAMEEMEVPLKLQVARVARVAQVAQIAPAVRLVLLYRQALEEEEQMAGRQTVKGMETFALAYDWCGVRMKSEQPSLLDVDEEEEKKNVLQLGQKLIAIWWGRALWLLLQEVETMWIEHE